MLISHRRRHVCRLCEAEDLSLAFALTPTPPANAFVTKAEINNFQPCFPLDVYFCNKCTHVQLLDIVDPKALFENYVYQSGTSPTFVKHFASYAADIATFCNLKRGDLVVDIGSNDGVFLREFQHFGATCLGVDPAKGIASAASASGIETWPYFFNAATAERILSERGHAKVIAANNVFAHIDALGEVTSAIRRLIATNGIFVFEVSYLLDVIEKTLFDTVYHEHLDYHSVGPIVPFLNKFDLELVDVMRVSTHGGSIRCIAGVRGGDRNVSPSVQNLMTEERRAGLCEIQTFKDFSSKIDGVGSQLKSLLAKLKAEGMKIAGFGAPAKATTLMYHFGLSRETVDYIVDDSPLKQNLYSPGLHIPVVAPTMLAGNAPDYLLVLAWNFADSIIKKNVAFSQSGGRFIIPIPQIEIV